MGELSQSAKCYLLQNQNATVKLEPPDFVADNWRNQEGFDQLGGGRGSSYCFTWNHRIVVLRHFLRGGFMAKLSYDRYFWLGKKKSRAWQEYRILESARALELPVPKVLGALAVRSGLWYQAAIITEMIPSTITLAQLLMKESLKSEAWFRLGEVIKRLQKQLFHHKDLNANNILVNTSGDFFIIDFDKATRRKSLGDWQWQTLYRLQRSLKKIDQKD